MKWQMLLGLALGILGSARPACAQSSPDSSTGSPGSYTPKVGGYIQARETYLDGPGLTAILNRARVTVEGPMPNHFSYRLMAEYEAAATSPVSTASVSLRDAFIKWANGNFSATAGQFKTPFSREYLMSITVMETPDRAGIESLGPKRDIGVVAEYLLVPDLTISAGVFNGEGQNASFNRDSTVMFVGRIAGRPLPHVQLGAATTLSGSDSTRIGLEAGFDFGGFSARGEYMRMKRDAAGDFDEGWYALAAYRLTAGLSLVARQESFDRRVTSPALHRQDATTAGALYDFPGGKMRAWLDWKHNKTRFPGATEDSFVAQLQVKY